MLRNFLDFAASFHAARGRRGRAAAHKPAHRELRVGS
jgi:hypothetical protein